MTIGYNSAEGRLQPSLSCPFRPACYTHVHGLHCTTAPASAPPAMPDRHPPPAECCLLAEGLAPHSARKGRCSDSAHGEAAGQVESCQQLRLPSGWRQTAAGGAAVPETVICLSGCQCCAGRPRLCATLCIPAAQQTRLGGQWGVMTDAVAQAEAACEVGGLCSAWPNACPSPAHLQHRGRLHT